MGEFLRIIVDLVKEYFIPWHVIYQGRMGVRWTRGKHVRNLKPGFWFFCPVIQHIEDTGSCYQEVDCLLQTFTTSDDKSISLSANVGFEIYNAAKYHTEVYNFDSTIERAIRGHVFQILHALSYAEIRAAIPALSEDLRDKIHAQATDWGVRIKQVRLTDFVSAPTYRILNEAPNFMLGPPAAP